MLVTLYQWKWLPPTIAIEAVRMDPVRMAQGIMTGIGFLGAGVIFKFGYSGCPEINIDAASGLVKPRFFRIHQLGERVIGIFS